jgi:hypothetical protein
MLATTSKDRGDAVGMRRAGTGEVLLVGTELKWQSRGRMSAVGARPENGGDQVRGEIIRGT